PLGELFQVRLVLGTLTQQVEDGIDGRGVLGHHLIVPEAPTALAATRDLRRAMCDVRSVIRDERRVFHALRRAACDPRPATRDPRPATRDPRPATRDPRSAIECDVRAVTNGP